MKLKDNGKINVYVDMDGVLADFNGEENAIQRFSNEKGFFKKLHIMNEWGFTQLLKEPMVQVWVLSASPNKQADKDKRAWLRYYYPKLKRKNIIFCRLGDNKADFVRTKNAILLDDYGKNVERFKARGFDGIKVEKPLQEYFHELLPYNYEW